MAKWINKGKNKVGTFGAAKRGNMSNGSKQNLRIFAKTKDMSPISIFVDENVPQRAKY